MLYLLSKRCKLNQQKIDLRSYILARGGISPPQLSPLSVLDICQQVGEKFKDPERVLAMIDSEVQDGKWVFGDRQELSLAYGLPGIALMTTLFESVFPDDEWPHITNAYIRMIIDRLENAGSPGPSLFLGNAGICVAVFLASKGETRYQKLLAQMDDLLLGEIHREFLTPIHKYLDSSSLSSISPGIYNLIEGVSGSLAYLSLRTSNEEIRNFSIKILEKLVQLMSRDKMINGDAVPSWYISCEDQLTLEEKQKYPFGNFNITTPYGVTGLLSILSIFAIEGVVVPGQYELIQKIAVWLQATQKNTDIGPCWEHTVFFEHQIKQNKSPGGLTRDAWCYGVPAITRSVFLAATALKNFTLQKFAEDTYLKTFQKPEREWNLIGTSFSYGRAGFLAIAQCMAEDTGSSFLSDQCKKQEKDLIRYYDPSYPFGFRMVTIKEDGDYMWMNNPGLLDGSAGIVSVLLQGSLKKKCSWGRVFLLS